MQESRLHRVGGLWQRIPIPIRAVVTGVVVLFLGTLPWSGLVALNLKLAPGVPWAVPVMALYGWLFCKYLDGWGWPRSTTAARRLNLRWRMLPWRVWFWALAAGGSAVSALLALAFAGLRLGTVPAEAFDEYARLDAYPAGSVVLWLLMSAVVAGVVEEAAFRGYMQAPIERRLGIVPALATVGVIFYVLHLAPLIALPGFLLGTVAWGLLAYLTGSILPGMMLHVAVDSLSFLGAWSNHEQAQRLASASVWTSGGDAGFWLAACLALGLGLASAPAYWMLARITRLERHGKWDSVNYCPPTC
jgi:membrane protease YdiL (CAAX protease family)